MKSRLITKFASLIDSRLFWHAAIPACRLIGAVKSGVRWAIFAGYAHERLGNLEKAKGIYEKAAAECAAASKILELRWLHVVQFLLERTYYDTGTPRVDDPLFNCVIKPSSTPARKPVGYYKADFVLMGMKIMGVVPGTDAESVEIRINGDLLRRVNIGKGTIVPEFNFMVKRPAIAFFPKKLILTIATDKGETLAAFGGSSALELTIPHGSGELETILKSGGKLDKKGVIIPQRRRPVRIRTRTSHSTRKRGTSSTRRSASRCSSCTVRFWASTGKEIS